MAHVFELAQFRHLLRIEARNLNVPHAVLRKKISQEAVPTWLVQRAIRRHRAIAAEARGSDLTDSYLVSGRKMHYLLSLALYADLTIVDKRTKENLRRARKKEPGTTQLLGAVEKANSYTAVLPLLEEVAGPSADLHKNLRTV